MSGGLWKVKWVSSRRRLLKRGPALPYFSFLFFCFAPDRHRDRQQKVTKEKAIFFQRLRRKKSGSTLLLWGIQFSPAARAAGCGSSTLIGGVLLLMFGGMLVLISGCIEKGFCTLFV